MVDVGFRMWKKSLEALFDIPAGVILIVGRKEVWKVGKTDFALKLAEWLLRFKIIHKFASNIKLYPKPQDYRFINDMPNLKRWMFNDRISKVYIYDEAMSSTPKRRAMTKLNTGWLTLIAQLSKGSCKVIVISQAEQYVESVFYNPTFTKGVIEKINKKQAIIRSPLLTDGEIHLQNIPRTTYRFDPFEIYTFGLHGDFETDGEDEDLNMVYEWLNHGSMQKIARQRNLHYQQVKRRIIDKVKVLVVLEKSV